MEIPNLASKMFYDFIWSGLNQILRCHSGIQVRPNSRIWFKFSISATLLVRNRPWQVNSGKNRAYISTMESSESESEDIIQRTKQRKHASGKKSKEPDNKRKVKYEKTNCKLHWCEHTISLQYGQTTNRQVAAWQHCELHTANWFGVNAHSVYNCKLLVWHRNFLTNMRGEFAL